MRVCLRRCLCPSLESLRVCRLAQALVLGFGKCELLDLRDNSAVSRVCLRVRVLAV